MKKNPLIYDYFDIDETPVFFKNKNGDVTEKKYDLKHHFQLQNLNICDEQTGKVIEMANASDYIDQFWKRIMSYPESSVSLLLDYHYERAKDKRKFWEAIRISLEKSPEALFGFTNLRSGRNQPFKNKTNLVIEWLNDKFGELPFDPISLMGGIDESKLDKICGFLTQGKVRYMTNNFGEFKTIMTGEYKYGSKINFDNLPQTMVIKFFDTLSENTSVINDEYLNKQSRLKPEYIAELVSYKNQPFEKSKITRARADYKKTEVRITHRKFIDQITKLINEL